MNKKFTLKEIIPHVEKSFKIFESGVLKLVRKSENIELFYKVVPLFFEKIIEVLNRTQRWDKKGEFNNISESEIYLFLKNIGKEYLKDIRSPLKDESNEVYEDLICISINHILTSLSFDILNDKLLKINKEK